MVDLGEAEIFERHVAQACDRIVGRDFRLPDILEKFADRCGVHERFRLAPYVVRLAVGECADVKVERRLC
jgi:hypothetical protein